MGGSLQSRWTDLVTEGRTTTLPRAETLDDHDGDDHDDDDDDHDECLPTTSLSVAATLARITLFKYAP